MGYVPAPKKLGKLNKLGVRGVTEKKSSSSTVTTTRWQSRVYFNGKSHQLGMFSTLRDAGESLFCLATTVVVVVVTIHLFHDTLSFYFFFYFFFFSSSLSLSVFSSLFSFSPKPLHMTPPCTTVVDQNQCKREKRISLFLFFLNGRSSLCDLFSIFHLFVCRV